MKSSARHLTQGGVIAALYVMLTMLSQSMGLASGQFQVRLGESLCLLPCFFPAAVPGLTVGCLLSNLLCGAPLWDVLAGTLATLLAAVATRRLSYSRVLAVLPPIAVNALLVPPVLKYAYGLPVGLPLLTVSVGVGQLLACGVLGQLVYSAIDKQKHRL